MSTSRWVRLGIAWGATLAQATVAGRASADPADRADTVEQRPAVGSLSKEGLDDYLARFDEKHRRLEARRRLAKSRDERARLARQLRALDDLREREVERLSRPNHTLVGIGVALTMLGAGAVVASAGLAGGYWESGSRAGSDWLQRGDVHRNGALATASIACLAGGLGTMAIGIPVLDRGFTRTPVPAEDVRGRAVGGFGSGVSVGWRF